MGINRPQDCDERLESLRQWQHNEKHRFNLREFARAGFFFELSFDIYDDPGRLRCAFCPVVIGNWQPEDDPWTEHALSVDHCQHVVDHKGQDFVERVKKEEEALSQAADDLFNYINQDATSCELHLEQASMGLLGVPTTAVRREQKVNSSISSRQPLESVTRCNSCYLRRCDTAHGNCERKLGVSERNLEYKESRLLSFDHVRHLFESDGLLNQIVESGFYFEGIDAYGIKVRCYRCSLALYDICENDDVWRAHAEMSNCAHVRERKGQDFIQEVKAADTGDNQETVPSSDCRAKKRKQCESTGDNFDTGMSKKPFAQRPIPCQEHQPKISCTQQLVAGKEPDTKKLRIHPSVQNKKHGMDNQLTRQSVLSKEPDAKKLRTHQSVQNGEHDRENQFTRQSVLSKEQDAKKLCTNQSVQNGEHDRDYQFTRQSVLSKEQDAKKLRTHQSMQNKENDIEKQLTSQSVLSEEQDAKRLRTHQSTQNKEQDRENQVTRQSVFSKEYDAKKMCPHQSMRKNKQHFTEKISTHQSVQCKNHDTYVTASGRKRRPRYCSYNGRWCLIKWRSLVASSSFCGQQDSDLESGCTSSDTHRGTTADEVVFLCCYLKLCWRNGGQGPCPNCFQNKHV